MALLRSARPGRARTRPMSPTGHERRRFKWRLLDDFRYAPGSDRSRVAAQYVARCLQQTSLLERGELFRQHAPTHQSGRPG
jgi:hypothetical protein